MSKFKTTACFLSVVSIAAVVGCTSISIAPECPGELRVGETGDLISNVQQPGEIPRYKWEVLPATAGTIGNMQTADTTFQALQEGTAIVRLTASDGIYQMIDECVITITGAIDLAVSLNADPDPQVVDETVTLTCTSVGADEASSFSIVQTAGNLVDLVSIDPGVVRFTPNKEDDLTFRCIGSNGEGQSSPAATLTLTIEPAPDDGTTESPADDTNASPEDDESDDPTGDETP